MIKIALFASGSGTNAENIANYFKDSKEIEITTILCSSPTAYVLTRAEKLNIPTFVFNKQDFMHTDKVLNYLQQQQIDLIVLAGFLWLVPSTLVEHYSGRIINIHPALMPKHCGKGMYGMKVHQEVVDQHDLQSGITIHQVNEKFDDGSILFQATCPVCPSDTAEEVAQKVHQLEYAHFPHVIEEVALGLEK
ncbi:MAG: phosphoribosylglycinamide formyltransferase [Bacteroidaceae bacterium]